MDVGSWLRSLGLGQYGAAFTENAIAADVLLDLTDSDLEKLGVPLGDRKRLLKAIASLGPALTPSQPRGPPATAAPREDAAERRQLTVMFCDLAGSTAMSARLDPEDTREVIRAYQDACSGAVARYDGFVAKFMGDGVLAYFGYPQAHEDDAERAVRAGLAIVEAAPKLQTPAGAPLHVRVGLATGIVVVGDLLGSGEAQERGVVGDTPHLAARLQVIAQPDCVVIAEGTRKLVGDLFEIVDLGPQDLKGVKGPTRAFVALRPSSQENRFEALHAGALTALVGREEELEVLLRRWTKAKAGGGQVALISGEAGIGKSRLTAAFLERLADEQHARLHYFCSPQHTDSVLHPIIGHMARAARFSREDDANTRLDKLDALLDATSTSRADAALLAELLSLPNDGRYPALELSPLQRRQKTLEALTGQIDVLARQSPVLMILEDAHWADHSSLELFGRLVDKIDDQRVLLFVTFRPEFAAPWIDRSNVTALTINRLAPREALALIDHILGNKLLPEAVKHDIVERTDGVPLFIEEMTRAVMEAESEGEATKAAAATPWPARAIPASLHASLMARLDRLGNAKSMAQIGAAIGREFSHTLLAAVERENEAELTSSLDRLVGAGLLYRQGSPPHATYLFKHALIQDTAYGTLLREPRRALHARIAEAIESRFPEVAESQPETLARHCTEAGLIEKAASLWGKAGQRSLRSAAFPEAEGQLTRALAQITSLPSAPVLRREQIKLQVGLSYALMQTKGYGASETKAAFEQARVLIQRAEALGEPAEDPLALFSILYGVWVWNFAAFNSHATLALATQFLTLARERDETLPLAIGHRMIAGSLLVAGEIAKAREHFDSASALYNPDEHRPLVARIGHDLGVMTLCNRGIDLWLLGYPEAARADIDRALRDAREFKHAATLMYALTYNSIVNALRRDIAKAQADELVALADEKGAVFWKASGGLVKSWLFVLTGRASDAITSFSSAIAMFRSTGATIFVPLFLSILGSAFAELRQFDQARRCIDEAMALAEASGERWFDAEIYRIAGEIELRSSERKGPNAQRYFGQALGVARAQQARSCELRAATSLARLWRGQGRRTEARDLLAGVYDWFTEGFDTLDLIEAKALLVELAS
jgi:class 3 adenylate cyclase/predicted ATPase